VCAVRTWFACIFQANVLKIRSFLPAKGSSAREESPDLLVKRGLCELLVQCGACTSGFLLSACGAYSIFVVIRMLDPGTTMVVVSCFVSGPVR
jgi:hypothetical protein